MRRSLTFVAVAAIGLSTLAACSAGPTRRAADAPGRAASAGADDGVEPPIGSSTTDSGGASTAAPPTRDLAGDANDAAPLYATTTPLYSFDGSVAPPEIVNTGSDYVAIARSLLGYVSWLKLHNPDVRLLANVYVEGTDLIERISPNLVLLAEHNLRYVDVDQSVEIETVTIDSDLVTFKALEHITAERLVDPTGKVVDEKPSGPLNTYIVVMTADSDGRWRIADIAAAYTEPRVQL